MRTTAMKERARFFHFADKQHAQQEELLSTFIQDYGKMSKQGLSEDIIRQNYLTQATKLQKSFEEFDMKALKPTEEARTKDLAKGSGLWRDDFQYQFGKDMRKLDIRTNRDLETQSLKTFRKLDRRESVSAKSELDPVWQKQKTKADAVITTRVGQFTESEFIDRAYMSGKKFMVYRTKSYKVCIVCKKLNGKKFPISDVMRNLVPRPDGKSPIDKFSLQDDIKKAEKATPIGLARNKVRKVRGDIQKLNNEFRTQEKLPLKEFMSPEVQHRRKQIINNIGNKKYDLDKSKKNYEELMPPVKDIKSTLPIGLDGAQMPLRAFIDGLDSTEARPELGMLAYQKTDHPPDAVKSVHDWIAKTAAQNLKDSKVNPAQIAAWLPEDKLNTLYESAAGVWNSPQGRDWSTKGAGWDEQSKIFSPLFESLADPRNITYRKMPRDVINTAFVTESEKLP